MIYCNCYQRFKKFNFEINATLKKIKKKLINVEAFYNRINSGQKREDPGNEDLFLVIAIVTYSKYVFVSEHLFRRPIYENLNFFKRLARLSTQLFVFVAFLALKLKSL